MTNEEKYNAFLAAIDTSVAGKDRAGHDLRWNIACSAEANAGDMQAEGTAAKTEEGFYAAALLTAETCLDDWRGHYPYLILTADAVGA